MLHLHGQHHLPLLALKVGRWSFNRLLTKRAEFVQQQMKAIPALMLQKIGKSEFSAKWTINRRKTSKFSATAETIDIWLYLASKLMLKVQNAPGKSATRYY